jgi:hypothetical protein
MFYVYMLTDPRKNDAPFYIGKGSGNRAFSHGKKKEKGSEFKDNVIDAIRKTGLQHGVVIVQDLLSEQESWELEKELISKYGRREIDEGGILTNRTPGGSGGPSRIGKKNSESHIEAVRQANLGNQYCKGRKRPQDEINRISSANTGKKRSIETKRKLSESHIGLKQTDETKKKRADKLRGLVRTEEQKAKYSESKTGEKNPMYGKDSPFKGKRHTEESKEKIKKARSKQIISEETKQKMAESQRKRHALRRLSIEEFLK